MAHYDFDLQNDEAVSITIKCRDPSGKFEPLPVGDEFSLTNSNEAALSAEIGTDHVGAPALILSRRVAEAQGIRVEVSDKLGLNPVTLNVNIIPNPAARGLDLDITNSSASPLPVPESKAKVVPKAKPEAPAAYSRT